MANFHMTVKVFGRSKGQSVIAAAAYRAGKLGEPLLDEETGLISDFSKKSGVISSKIYLPKDAPPEFQNRSKLWNTATRSETRKNSTLAREIEISLPNEVDDKFRERLIEMIAIEIVERHGCAVDANQHHPSLKRMYQGDGVPMGKLASKNIHVHLMLTTRVLQANGFGRKTRELDCRSSKEVEYWRARVAVLINETYAEAGLPMRVDHRSLKARGIFRAPQRHRGPSVTAMMRKGRSNMSYVLKRQLKQELYDKEIVKEAVQYRELVLEIKSDRKSIQNLRDYVIDERFARNGTANKLPLRASTPGELQAHPPSPSPSGNGTYVIGFDVAEQSYLLDLPQYLEHFDSEESDLPMPYQRERG